MAGKSYIFYFLFGVPREKIPEPMCFCPEPARTLARMRLKTFQLENQLLQRRCCWSSLPIRTALWFYVCKKELEYVGIYLRVFG